MEPDQYSLAIGKGGQNARLAARLTGWKIDIRTTQPNQENEPVKEVADEESGANDEKEGLKDETKKDGVVEQPQTKTGDPDGNLPEEQEKQD